MGRSNKSSLCLGLYLGAFLLQIPGFFIYQQIVAYGAPPFVGGYVAATALLVLPLLAVVFVLQVVNRRVINRIDIAFFCCIAVLSLIGIGTFDLSNGYHATRGYMGTLPIWLSLYLLARLVPIDNPNLKRLLLMSHVTIVAIIFGNTQQGTFTLGHGETTATYQFFASLYLVLIVISAAHSKEFVHNWIFILTSVVGLVVIGARSELLVILIITVARLLSNKNYIKNIAVGALAFGVLYVNMDAIVLLEKNRVYDFIFKGAEANLAVREAANNQAIDTILKNPALGDFASYPEGLYAHNITSIWVDFGILGFAVYIITMVIAIVAVFLMRSTGDSKQVVNVSRSLIVSVVALLIATKSGTFLLVPVGIGLIALSVSRRYNKRSIC